MELLKENDPALLEVSTPWDFEVDGSPEELVKEMMKVMIENGGVGLAAPQVGIAKRVFIMGNFTKMVACINPKIEPLTDEGLHRVVTELEGCLSFPDLFMKIKRPASFIVLYQNIKGEIIERELTGMEARVYLHEYDHLHGTTFDQRAGALTLTLAKERRKKEAKKAARAR